MEVKEMAMMTVRSAAQVLGVHENTVRNWESRGLLRAIHLPGSGFRRFPEEEVRTLAEQMRASLMRAGEPDVVDDERVVAVLRDPILDDQD